MNTVVKKRKPRSGKGENTALNILQAAENLLIEQGYHNFSLRKVAATAGLTLGNLQYYYSSKDALIIAMLDHSISGYIERFENLMLEAGDNAEQQFRALMTEVILDLNNKSTTLFFPEVWVLSNHYPHAIKFMDSMYGRYREILIEVMGRINPTLSQEQLATLAVFISSSIEGHTMFIGHKKPWRKDTQKIVDIALQSFLWLIHHGEIPKD